MRPNRCRNRSGKKRLDRETVVSRLICGIWEHSEVMATGIEGSRSQDAGELGSWIMTGHGPGNGKNRSHYSNIPHSQYTPPTHTHIYHIHTHLTYLHIHSHTFTYTQTQYTPQLTYTFTPHILIYRVHTTHSH
jgi:hypothetical protein